jgi:hypothetical protein
LTEIKTKNVKVPFTNQFSNILIMNKLSLSIAILFMFLIMSCGPTQRITSSWINPKITEKPQYKKIFITVLAQNPGYKATIEQDLAYAANAKGLQVVKSSEFFQPNFTSKDNVPVDKSVILAKVREAGCDVIFTVALVDKKSETRYVPGTTAYSPYMGYGGFGFSGYYGYAYPAMYSTPGYYTEDKTYFLEAHLFDAATENMLWSAQSEAYDPTKISKFSQEYAAILVERMNRDINEKFKKK